MGIGWEWGGSGWGLGDRGEGEADLVRDGALEEKGGGKGE